MTASSRAILIVDDDADIREALVDVLSDHGYVASSVANGREALELLRAGDQPGLILLDLMMPVMDGVEFRREQLEDPTLRELPVVLISAGNDLGRQASLLGAADAVQKPIDLSRLLTAIARQLAPQ